jgi:hypothetical protein
VEIVSESPHCSAHSPVHHFPSVSGKVFTENSAMCHVLLGTQRGRGNAGTELGPRVVAGMIQLLPPGTQAPRDLQTQL